MLHGNPKALHEYHPPEGQQQRIPASPHAGYMCVQMNTIVRAIGVKINVTSVILHACSSESHTALREQCTSSTCYMVNKKHFMNTTLLTDNREHKF